MRKLRRILFSILCLCLFLGSAANLLPRACAVSPMTVSESCLEFIKEIEGFSSKPYYDYKQHTVGYGTKCPTEKYFDYLANGISRAEAEALLRKTISELEETIYQKFIKKYNLEFTQHQFDALVCFSFNVGTSWVSYDSTLRNTLLRHASEDDLVYAFTLYCTAGGSYSSGLISRRLCEANMYLNGIYSTTPNHAFGYVFYEPNGGSLTYQVQGFLCENNTVPAVEAVRNGDVFLGWYTDLSGGSRVTELNSTLSGKTLFARWQSSENMEMEDSPSVLVRVTGDVVNIRKGPGTNYGIAKQVYRNDLLIVSHASQLSGRIWGKVRSGWICLDYTNYDDVLNGTGDTDSAPNEQPSDGVGIPDNPTPPNDSQSNSDSSPERQDAVSATVQVNDLLRIRSGPGTAYSTVGYLHNGSQVELLEQKYADSMAWGRISRGWISMDYIVIHGFSDDNHTKPTESWQEVTVPVYETESTYQEGKIIADALMIRSGPGTDNSIIGFYYQDEMVLITEKVLVNSVYWGKTDKGWIHMDYVVSPYTAEDPQTSQEYHVMTVIADCLRVRKQIGTDSRIADLLYYGEQVTVFETRTVDGTVWGRVHKGWICMDYVE